MGHIMRYIENVVTLKLDTEKCIGCGQCVEVCPRKVITMLEKKAVIVNRDLCIECGACKMNCAYDAISVDNDVAFYLGKIQTGTFYMDRVMPGVFGKLERLKSNEDGFLDMPIVCF